MAKVVLKNQIKSRLKKGDQVIVIAGKNKGKTGAVERVDRKHDKIYVSGVNTVKRHTKPSVTSPQGGIVEKIAPLHVCNVMLLDPKDKKPTRVGFKTVDGKKVRVAKRSGTVLA
jgi:large subunit ribosomal protein L24